VAQKSSVSLSFTPPVHMQLACRSSVRIDYLSLFIAKTKGRQKRTTETKYKSKKSVTLIKCTTLTHATVSRAESTTTRRTHRVPSCLHRQKENDNRRRQHIDEHRKLQRSSTLTILSSTGTQSSRTKLPRESPQSGLLFLIIAPKTRKQNKQNKKENRSKTNSRTNTAAPQRALSSFSRYQQQGPAAVSATGAPQIWLRIPHGARRSVAVQCSAEGK